MENRLVNRKRSIDDRFVMISLSETLFLTETVVFCGYSLTETGTKTIMISVISVIKQ